jgi:hypothetical protein
MKDTLSGIQEQATISIANDYTLKSFHRLQGSTELIHKTLIQIESNNQSKK